jgi:hypothetical protein
MNDDAPLPAIVTYTYSTDGRLLAITDATGRRDLTADTSDSILPPRPAFAMTHDPEKRVFVLTGPDGKTEVFRDNPTRYLAVAPDPENGEMKPVMKYGRPTYLWLCREEREVH